MWIRIVEGKYNLAINLDNVCGIVVNKDEVYFGLPSGQDLVFKRETYPANFDYLVKAIDGGKLFDNYLEF